MALTSIKTLIKLQLDLISISIEPPFYLNPKSPPFLLTAQLRKKSRRATQLKLMIFIAYAIFLLVNSTWQILKSRANTDPSLLGSIALFGVGITVGIWISVYSFFYKGDDFVTLLNLIFKYEHNPCGEYAPEKILKFFKLLVFLAGFGFPLVGPIGFGLILVSSTGSQLGLSKDKELGVLARYERHSPKLG
ncbi:hypothetical protein Fcan01_19124 [Folsomia candida]|uniref:Uncharacterized protein n=1 Tax=Folsomia candida TaxID=158441 RepID=A0A226DLV7_FOLCA|nr:hypothetical protein Fcan01_19124 [Folsomia candida]